LSAKCDEAGGIDLIVIYNSGRFRMAGRGSLAGMMPYGNANQIVREMASEVLSIVRHTPVLAGVCGTDPFLLREPFLRELQALGFAGIQNFPTVGVIDGVFRANLEETGMGFGLEVELIAAARQMNLLTTPYAFNAAEGRKMAQAGADIVVAHMGLTTSGTIGAHTARTRDGCVAEVQAIADACKAVRTDCLVLCHGGPIASPQDAQFILERCTGVEGFYGASSMERVPTEKGITAQVRQFGKLRLSQAK
jgi:predicted TIM-barrel enzyme